MASDLTTAATDRDQIRQCFSELRGATDEIEALVSDSLDELATISARIDQRQAELDEQHGELRRQLTALAESQRRLDESSTLAGQSAGRLQESIARLEQNSSNEVTSELGELRAERERLREQSAAAQAQAQSIAENVAADLTQARAELVAASEALLRERERLTAAATPLHEALTAQIALLEERSAALVATLSTIPQDLAASQPAGHQPDNAAQRAPAAGQQHPAATAPAIPAPEVPPDEKSIEAPARHAWSAELEGLRTGLTKGARVPAKGPASPADTKALEGACGGEDRTLDSVMAQFEILQNDLSGRRQQERPARPNPRQS